MGEGQEDQEAEAEAQQRDGERSRLVEGQRRDDEGGTPDGHGRHEGHDREATPPLPDGAGSAQRSSFWRRCMRTSYPCLRYPIHRSVGKGYSQKFARKA